MNTIIPTVFHSGVKRLRTLNGPSASMLYGLGAAVSQDTLDGMAAEGYDMGMIDTLVSMGATNEQLVGLWNNYGANTQEFGVAAANLMNQLGGAQAGAGRPASSAGSYPQSAVPTTVSTAFGVYDLTQQASWDALTGQFIAVQQQLNALAQMAPRDADVIQMVQNFNSLVGQWASYYDQAFGSAPSNLPLASIPTLGALTLGVAPLVIAGIAAAVVALLAALYLLKQNIAAKKALVEAQGVTQAQASTGTLANTAQQLQTQIAAANAAGNTALAQQLMSQYNATISAIGKVAPGPLPAGTLSFSAWFQQNWGYLALLLGAVVILPAAMGKRR
jgi:hypothetical protein